MCTVDLCVEGIFRLNGGPSRQRELESRLRDKQQVNFKAGIYTVHDCATVLKRILSDFEEPLLHKKLLKAYLHTNGTLLDLS